MENEKKRTFYNQDETEQPQKQTDDQPVTDSDSKPEQPEAAAQTDAPDETKATAKEEKEKEKEKDKKKKKKDCKAQLEEKEQELADQKDQYLRLMAEYQNYRNRTTEEKKKIYGDAKVDCVKEILVVLDSFERAMEAACADETYKKGIEMTFGQMTKALEKMGITEVPALGTAFDPNVHNAIKQVDDSEYESDVVCQVFQKGYVLGDRLIRPAMVAVAV